MGGGRTEVNVGALLPKRAAIVGTVLRARPLEEKIDISRRFAAEVLPLFDAGAVRPVIDSRFAARRHRRGPRPHGVQRQRRQDPRRRPRLAHGVAGPVESGGVGGECGQIASVSMAGPTDDETQPRDRRGDLLFLGIGLGALGLLLFLARDLAPVTGVLTSELARALGIVFLVLGVVAAVAEVGLMLERDGGPGWSRRRGRGAVAPVHAATGGTDGSDGEVRVDPPADVVAAGPTRDPEEAPVEEAVDELLPDDAVTADDAERPVAAHPASPSIEAFGFAALDRPRP